LPEAAKDAPPPPPPATTRYCNGIEKVEIPATDAPPENVIPPVIDIGIFYL
jgi:hypothetical protein